LAPLLFLFSFVHSFVVCHLPPPRVSGFRCEVFLPPSSNVLCQVLRLPRSARSSRWPTPLPWYLFILCGWSIPGQGCVFSSLRLPFFFDPIGPIPLGVARVPICVPAPCGSAYIKACRFSSLFPVLRPTYLFSYFLALDARRLRRRSVPFPKVFSLSSPLHRVIIQGWIFFFLRSPTWRVVARLFPIAEFIAILFIPHFHGLLRPTGDAVLSIRFGTSTLLGGRPASYVLLKPTFLFRFPHFKNAFGP